ncbi:hypothetical protein VP01_3008g2 [Puccinia sorghi]|uniref:Uncharacterized protein n=1 Tax=Puccinia sorghi TaxID=27349 RepID=A0A0L6V0B4_9BASI|nr:hypothetical protein VP01_3008g2 [Puccinia sorghi]
MFEKAVFVRKLIKSVVYKRGLTMNLTSLMKATETKMKIKKNQNYNNQRLWGPTQGFIFVIELIFLSSSCFFHPNSISFVSFIVGIYSFFIFFFLLSHFPHLLLSSQSSLNSTPSYTQDFSSLTAHYLSQFSPQQMLVLPISSSFSSPLMSLMFFLFSSFTYSFSFPVEFYFFGIPVINSSFLIYLIQTVSDCPCPSSFLKTLFFSVSLSFQPFPSTATLVCVMQLYCHHFFKLHIFGYVNVLAQSLCSLQSWIKKRSFLGVSACQLQASKCFFEIKTENNIMQLNIQFIKYVLIERAELELYNYMRCVMIVLMWNNLNMHLIINIESEPHLTRIQRVLKAPKKLLLSFNQSVIKDFDYANRSQQTETKRLEMRATRKKKRDEE